MAGTFQEKSSKIFLTIFIGFIAISFMFTGYESMMGTPETIAKVGSKPITIGEFQRAYRQQEQFYNQIYGGNIPAQQRKGLNRQTMNSLIQTKTRVILADRLGITPGTDEIKAEIKEFPAFQSNKQFDINRYKILLANNGLTPTKFESNMAEDIKLQTAQELLTEVPVSNAYLSDVQKFRKNEFRAQVVSVKRSALKKYLPVSNTEIEKYLEDKANLARVESTFNSRKSSLGRDEEVRARHILLKVDGKNEADVKKRAEELAKKATPKNFAEMAKKHSEGPTKNNGGDLNWFARGRMVKGFEEVAFSQKKGEISGPVKTQFGYHIIYTEDKRAAVEAKFEDHKNSIAKEFIQNGKTKELTELAKKVSDDVRKSLEANKVSQVERLRGQYGLSFDKDISINQLDGSTGSTQIKPEFMAEIFSKDLDSTNYYTFNEGDQTIIVKTSKMVESKKEKTAPKNDEEEAKGLRATWGRKAAEDMTAAVQESVKTKVFNSRIRNL